MRAAARSRTSRHSNTLTRDLQQERHASSVLKELCVFILLHAHSWRFGRLHGIAARWQQLQPMRIEACAAALRARARDNLNVVPHEAEATARKLTGSRGTGALGHTLERLQFSRVWETSTSFPPTWFLTTARVRRLVNGMCVHCTTPTNPC